MKHAILVLIALFVLAASQEVSVPFDSTGKIQVVDEKLNKQLGLFPNISGFKQAQIFKVSDTLYSLEVTREENGKLIRERKTMTRSEYLRLTAKVDSILAVKPIASEIRAAKIKLLTGSLILSAGYYGWALPYSMDIEDDRSVVALYMLTSASGFLIPLLATRGQRVTDAEATMAIYGGTRGIIHGVYISRFLKEDPNSRYVHGVNVATSIIEGVTGCVVAHKTKMSSGTADIIGACGDFGSWLGWGTAFLADYTFDDHPKEKSGLVLLGQALGIAAGKLWSEKQDFTRGDATIVYGSGVLGGFLGGGIAQALDRDNADLTVGSAMVGSVLGLVAGGAMTKGRDFTTGQAALIALSETACGLLGLGISYLTTDNWGVYTLGTALGAGLGFGLAYKAFEGKVKVGELGRLSVNVNLLMLSNINTCELSSDKGGLPIIMLTWEMD